MDISKEQVGLTVMNATTFLSPFLELLLPPFGLNEAMPGIVSMYCRDRWRMNISWTMSSVLFMGCVVGEGLKVFSDYPNAPPLATIKVLTGSSEVQI